MMNFLKIELNDDVNYIEIENKEDLVVEFFYHYEGYDYTKTKEGEPTLYWIKKIEKYEFK